MRKGIVDGIKIHRNQVDTKEIDIFSTITAPATSEANGSLALQVSSNGSVWFRKNSAWLALGYQDDIDQNATDITNLQSSISGFETIQRYKSLYIPPQNIVLPSGSGVTRQVLTGSNGMALNVLTMPTTTQTITTEPFIMENWDEDITEVTVRIDINNNGSTTGEELELDCTIVQFKTGTTFDRTPDDFKTVAQDTRAQYIVDQSAVIATFSASNTNFGYRNDSTVIAIRRRGGEDEATDSINIQGVWISWQTRDVAFEGVEAGTLPTAGYTNTLSTDFPGTSGNSAATGSYTDMSSKSDFTISMWFKLDNTPASSRYGLFYLGRNGDYYSAFLLPVSGSWRLYVYSNGAFKFYDAFPADTNWHHVVFVRSGTSETVYIDNVVDSPNFSSGTFSATSPTGSITMNLGVWGTSSPNLYYHDGHIDEVATWDIALSAGNVASLYADTDFSNAVQPGNCINYWRMGDGDTLPTVIDQQAIANLTLGAGCSFVGDVP